jgi:hypothetical protein
MKQRPEKEEVVGLAVLTGLPFHRREHFGKKIIYSD